MSRLQTRVKILKFESKNMRVELKKKCQSSSENNLSREKENADQLCYQSISSPRGTQRRFPPKRTEKSSQVIQSPFRSLEMHSKRRYKICICSSQRNLRLFEITRASVLLSRKFQKQLNVFTKKRIFLIPLIFTFLNPKILGFLFLRK